MSRQEMEELLQWGAYGALKGDDEALHRFCGVTSTRCCAAPPGT